MIYRYIYGLYTFVRTFRMQWGKDHGKGRPSFRQCATISNISRWMVDGQHRGIPCPIRMKA